VTADDRWIGGHPGKHTRDDCDISGSVLDLVSKKVLQSVPRWGASRMVNQSFPAIGFAKGEQANRIHWGRL
jgi:hypothetical protein